MATEWENDTEWRNPTFSLAERDRRWALVRSKMAEQGMAAIICHGRRSSLCHTFNPSGW